MRKRSKSNSRKWEDLRFRQLYLNSKPFCEMSEWLRINAPNEVPGLKPRETATDPHHLFGGAGRRVDCELNLLAVCRPVHLWAHRKLKESRLLGIWLKVRGGVFDATQFKEISGKYLPGWLLLNEPEMPEFHPLWQQLKAEFP